MFSEGGWIVHSEYGVGQVKGVVKKEISGKATPYIKIMATQSTFWLPVKEMDNLSIRPLSTPAELEQALTILQQAPEEMPTNYKERHKQIQEARANNTMLAVAQILRDLRAQSRAKGNLTTSENRAWRALKQQFVEEWALVAGLSNEQAEAELEQYLNPSGADAGTPPA